MNVPVGPFTLEQTETLIALLHGSIQRLQEIQEVYKLEPGNGAHQREEELLDLLHTVDRAMAAKGLIP